MNTDFRVQVSLFTHPKYVKLGRRLGPAACLSLITLWGFTAVNHPDGNLSTLDAEDIAIAANYPGDPFAFMETLAELRLLDVADGDVFVHDWLDHNPWAAGQTARSLKARKAAHKKWGTPLPKDLEAGEKPPTRSERLAAARLLGTHTNEEWEWLKSECGNVCLRCGGGGPLVKDHIVPLYQGGSDALANIQPLCRACNSGKGTEAVDLRPERLQNACKTPAPLHHLTEPLPIPEPDDDDPRVHAREAVRGPRPKEVAWGSSSVSRGIQALAPEGDLERRLGVSLPPASPKADAIVSYLTAHPEDVDRLALALREAGVSARSPLAYAAAIVANWQRRRDAGQPLDLPREKREAAGAGPGGEALPSAQELADAARRIIGRQPDDRSRAKAAQKEHPLLNLVVDHVGGWGAAGRFQDGGLFAAIQRSMGAAVREYNSSSTSGRVA